MNFDMGARFCKHLGAEGMWEIYQFLCEPKTVLRNEIYYFNCENEIK